MEGKRRRSEKEAAVHRTESGMTTVELKEVNIVLEKKWLQMNRYMRRLQHVEQKNKPP